jgi:hypothetical protein
MKILPLLAGSFAALPLLTWAAAPSLRPLIVGLVAPTQDIKQVEKRLRATAKVPLQKLTEISPSLVGVTLSCKSARQCDAAQARLAAATSWIKSVDVDAVRTRPAPPAMSTPASAAAARNL